MNKKYKDNVIPFPNVKDDLTEKLKESREAVEYLTNESVDTAVYMLELMEAELEAMEGSVFHNMDFRDPEKVEARDMHAIVNLINAMFMRFAGIPHDLQQQLDTAYVKSKAIEKEPQRDFEITFEPDFEFPPEDDE
tara:strand:+ start:198 stop:605 length:408 start_codon:yes stop_codon:yes gene_type:complete